MLTKIAMTILRISLPVWIGGAVLFVITSVAEQRFSGFDSAMRDQLAAIRFPHYYRFCWATLGSATLASLILLLSSDRRNRTLALISGLITLSLCIAMFDYFAVYQPLLELITPPGKARTQEFSRLHDLSRQVNQLHLILASVAAIIHAAAPPRSKNTPAPTHVEKVT